MSQIAEFPPPPPEPPVQADYEQAVHPLPARIVDDKRRLDGGSFVFDTPAGVPAVWGSGDQVLWARGEPLLLVGPTGVGKSTISQQLVHGLIGIRDELLGLPVDDDGRRVLYLAMDRPSQAARSWRRMLHVDWRDRLAERVTVWKGPVPFNVVTEPHRFREFVEANGCGIVIIDSLKDLGGALEKPEVGSAVNLAFQDCVANGIDVLADHHQRKASADNKRPTSLSDVYGSSWLTAGAGSVVLLWGKAGDPIVELEHLKQPADRVGPWKLEHDHDRGETTVLDQVDPLEVLRKAPKGITARMLAQTITGDESPDRSEVARARRQLERLVGRKLAHRRDGSTAPPTPALYLPASLLEEPA